MDSINLVKAYYAALDSADFGRANEYLSDNYQLVDFSTQPMDRHAMLKLMGLLKTAMPNLMHSLSNIRIEGQLVKLVAQLSGINSAPLDLREMGIGIVMCTRKFIIFPNGDYEFTVVDGKITQERDVSPISPNRRMSGILKSLGVNLGEVQNSRNPVPLY
jgi:hypothetical protein